MKLLVLGSGGWANFCILLWFLESDPVGILGLAHITLESLFVGGLVVGGLTVAGGALVCLQEAPGRGGSGRFISFCF